MNIFITLITVLLAHVSDFGAPSNGTHYVPIPLDYEERGVYSSSNFVKRGGWNLVSPASKPFVQFIAPSRQKMLGARTDEWFDDAYLKLTPDVSGKADVGVIQPLGDQYPVSARAGDVFRVGLNLRCEKDPCANVIVQLRDIATGKILVQSSEIITKEPRRHFVDLAIPAPHDSESPIALALIAVSKSQESGGKEATEAVHVDQISVAKAVPDSKEFVADENYS